MPPGQQFWKDVILKTSGSAYWRKECSYCDGKAIYRRKNQTFCRFHKPIVLDLLKDDVEKLQKDIDPGWDGIIRRRVPKLSLKTVKRWRT